MSTKVRFSLSHRIRATVGDINPNHVDIREIILMYVFRPKFLPQHHHSNLIVYSNQPAKTIRCKWQIPRQPATLIASPRLVKPNSASSKTSSASAELYNRSERWNFFCSSECKIPLSPYTMELCLCSQKCRTRLQNRRGILFSFYFKVLTHAFIIDTSASNEVITTICFKINHRINLSLLEIKCRR